MSASVGMLITVNVGEVMSTETEQVSSDKTAREVSRLVGSPGTDIDWAAVVDDGELVGIVTQTDLVGVLADGTPEARASEFMSSPVVTIAPDDSVERAVRLLEEHGIERLVVEDEGKIEGSISADEVSYYVQRHHHRHDLGDSLDVSYEHEEWEFEHVDTDEMEGNVAVGDKVRFTRVVDEDDVLAFAEATGDTNRLHLDDEFAAETRFGRRIVHGTLVAGLVSAALARIPGLTIYLSQELSFVEAADIGDKLTAVCEISEDLGNNRYRLTTRVYGSDGEMVIDGEATVLVDEIREGERAAE